MRCFGAICLAACVLLVIGEIVAGPAAAAAPRLKVSENQRFLVYDDGKPFFYLGDTAWEIFHRQNRDDAQHYLADRAKKRFTVIQAVVLAEFDGLHEANAYGQKPLVNDDPARPNPEYFKHVDWIVDQAEKLGLFIGMLPTWGDKVEKAWGQGPVVFNPKNAAVYGEFLGTRYRNKPIIWILGGDRAVQNQEQLATWRAMAEGIRRGDGGGHLMTYHPPGGNPDTATSAKWFHNDPWLAFNMLQCGHDDVSPGVPSWGRIAAEYNRTPIKPVLDGEPLYEDHPIAFNAAQRGYSVAADIRRFAYWDVFAGACGHTYGNHSVWQMHVPARGDGVNSPLNYWRDAIQRPGAGQMQYLRALIESRPYLTRIPDQSVIVPAKVAASMPGAGLKHIQATRDSAGSYAMVYVPASRPFSVRMDKIAAATARAWWFSPRNGEAKAIGEFPAKGTREFVPPDLGEMLDWVLVLDDASKDYPPPGQTAKGSDAAQ